MSCIPFFSIHISFIQICIFFFLIFHNENGYNTFLVYCRELAPGTVSLTGDRAQGDDSKHDSHYTPIMPILSSITSAANIYNYALQTSFIMGAKTMSADL